MASKIPWNQIVFDDKTKTKYEIGRFLGKGGFAKCYELRNSQTKEIFAGKVISKQLLAKDLNKEKMSQEIMIHKSLSHKYIVGFHSFFEDDDNVYIMLEYCRKRSLMEMHKRRKFLTENEVRYFLHQIVQACIYLHENNVVHRDLKLGNIFINDEMEVKVGDFGLATFIGHEGERKKTVCGTPNYIAPEILTKCGHSFEVDVWSLGCIMYTLIVGMPPFETRTLKETYAKIKRNEYRIPSKVDKYARSLIRKMLKTDPSERPKMSEIFADDFFTRGYLPTRLPTSCLTTAPRFASNKNIEALANTRKVLADSNSEFDGESPTKKIKLMKLEDSAKNGIEVNDINIENCYLNELQQQLKSVTAKCPKTSKHIHDEILDPTAVPFLWISKWVDYTDKYGLGYQLCDNSTGVLFNDETRLIVFANEKDFNYIDNNGTMFYHTFQSYPSALKKKIVLIKYFQTYMADNLNKAGGSFIPHEGDEFTQLPYLKTWFRTKCAVVFHLTNGTLQINFFDDHTKIIICPHMGAVSFIDENKEFLVCKLSLIEQYGCSTVLFERLKYAKTMADKLATKTVCRRQMKYEEIKFSPKHKK